MSKIKFRVISCSGEDPQYPVTELLTQSPQSKGWQSPRFCEYPQEITLQFTAPVRIKQLQLLCHQSKIPSKIELYVYLPDMTSPIENNEYRYKKLGYIALDTNERSGYQARELKSVFLDNPCLYMKLLFHKCHINKYNLFNQVSLIALSVFGEFIAINEEMQKAVKAPAGAYDRLEYETQFDPMTLDRLRVLETAKEKAKKNEDYESAQRLKEAIDRLKMIGVQLQRLEERKMNAVKSDDYESAKIIKAEIDRLRSTIMPEALMAKFGAPSQNKGGDPLPPVQQNSHRPYSGLTQQNQPISPITQAISKKEVIEISKKEDPFPKGQDAGYQKPTENPFTKKNVEEEMENKSEIFKEQSDFNKKAVRKDIYNNHDDQVIPAMSNKQKTDNLDEFPADDRERQQKTDKLHPDTLKLCEGFIDVITERCCEQIFSKNWPQREEGLKFLENELNRPTTIHADDAASLFQAIFAVVNYTIGDKISQVSQRSLSLLMNLLAKPTPKFSPRNEMTTYIDNVLIVLLDKIGDNNARVKELAENAFLALANNPIITCQSCVNALIRGIQGEKNKKSNSFRHLAGRLTVLLEFVRNFGINNANVPFQSTVDFAIKGLDHQNPEVRNAAIALLVEIYRIVGDHKLMPLLENIRPAHMEILQAEFASATGIKPTKKNNDTGKDKENVQVVTNIKPQSGKPNKKTGNSNKGNTYSGESDKEETSNVKNPGKPALKSVGDQNKTCDFCQKTDKMFLDKGKLDIHLWKDCPMLTLCQMCEQVVEISCLNTHLLEECDFKKSFRKCPRCKEAIHSNNYKQHTDEMACLPNKPLNVANRCPLCHSDIMPGEMGWKSHLISEGCPNNERTSH